MSIGSIYFSQSGGNSRVSYKSSDTNLQLSGNFTFEFFFKVNSSINLVYPYPIIIGCQFPTVEGGINWTDIYISHGGAPNVVWVLNGSSGGGDEGKTTSNVVNDTWHHLAFVRSGMATNNVKIYVDGVLEETMTSTQMWSFSNFSIGGGADLTFEQSNQWYTGYISNLRILNGTALYTSNFSTPTMNLTNITNTVLLLKMAFSSPYTDSSSFNRTMTVFGTPTPSADSPFAAPPTPLPCFKEDTKILVLKNSSEQFVPVQELRRGDLVKTLCNGFVPIHLIGKKDIVHTSAGPRDKNKLYTCTQENYPELVEDLVITGCHSILVNDFVNDKQRADTLDVLGKIYITDSKYRLPACLDERADIYEKDGTFTIYHLALDSENYYDNYGICANGLLVESCSIRYLKELTNMELI
jgi:hypothetical protein